MSGLIDDDILAEIHALDCGDELKKTILGIQSERQKSYGSAERSFSRIAECWGDFLGMELYPDHISHMMMLLKKARLEADPSHLDSIIDCHSYEAISKALYTRRTKRSSSGNKKKDRGGEQRRPASTAET